MKLAFVLSNKTRTVCVFILMVGACKKIMIGGYCDVRPVQMIGVMGGVIGVMGGA